MMFFLTISFLIFASAEGQVTLNRTANLIPMDSGKHEGMDVQTKNHEVVKIWGEKVQAKKKQNSNQNVPGQQAKAGEAERSGKLMNIIRTNNIDELLKIGEQNRSDRLVEFGSLKPPDEFPETNVPKLISEPFLFDEYELPEEHFEIGSSKPVGEPVQSNQRNRLGQVVKFRELKPLLDDVQKSSEEEVETDITESFAKPDQPGPQNRSGEHVKLRGMVLPEDSIEISEGKRPEKDQIGRQAKFAGTRQFVDNAPFFRRRPYKRLGQFQGSERKTLGDELDSFQGQYYSREPVNSNRENLSGEQLKIGGQNLDDFGSLEPLEEEVEVSGMKSTSELFDGPEVYEESIEIDETKAFSEPEQNIDLRELVKFRELKPSDESLSSDIRKSSPERAEIGVTESSGKPVQSESQNRSGEHVKLGGRVSIGERNANRGKGQIGRREQLGGKRSNDSAQLVRRRPYGVRGQSQGHNGDLKSPKNGLSHLQDKYEPRELVTRRQNRSGELLYHDKETLPGKPVAIDGRKLKSTNGSVPITDKSGSEGKRLNGERRQLKGYKRNRRPHQFGEQNRLDVPDELGGRNRTGVLMKIGGQNDSFPKNLSDEQHAIGVPNRSDVLVELDSVKPPVDLIENSGLRRPGGPIQSVEQTHRKNKQVKLMGKKPIAESVSFGVHKPPGEPVEIGPPKSYGELIQSNVQKPTELFELVSEPPFTGQQRSAERVENGVPKPPVKSGQSDSQKRFDELLKFGESLLKRQRHSPERVAIGVPEPHGDPVKYESPKHLPEEATYEGLKHSVEMLKFGALKSIVNSLLRGQPRSPNLVGTGVPQSYDEPVQSVSPRRHPERAMFGRLKSSDELAELGGLRLPEEQFDIGGPVRYSMQSDEQSLPLELKKYRLVKINRQTEPENLSKTVRLGERSGLLRERMNTEESQFANQKRSRRLNNVGRPYPLETPYRRNGTARLRNGQRRRDRFGDQDQIGNQNPVRDRTVETHLHKRRNRTDEFGDQNQFDSERDRNRSIRRKGSYKQDMNDDENQHGNDREPDGLRSAHYSVRDQPNGNRQSTEEKDDSKQKVVIIIPVPNGMGDNMKTYPGVMSFLTQLFPRVFQT